MMTGDNGCRQTTLWIYYSKFQLGMKQELNIKLRSSIAVRGAFGYKANSPRSAFDRFDDNSNYRASYDPWTPENRAKSLAIYIDSQCAW